MDNTTRQPMEQDQIQYWPESFAIHQQQQKFPSSPLPIESNLTHPVPKSLYLANSNFSSFEGTYPKREAASPLARSNHSAEDLTLFNAQSSPNSSVTTFDEPCYTPMSSTFSTMNPASWASSSLSSASSTSSSFSSQNYHQASDAATMGTWTNIPYYMQPSSQHLPQAIDTTWDVPQPTNEDMMMFNCLPWLDINTDEVPAYFTSPVPEVTEHKAASYPLFTQQNQNIQPPSLQSQFQPQFYTTTPATATTTTANTAAPRPTVPAPSSTRNAFLIECKRRGLSYKDIKRLGGFKEAESTLRGRFRTLTKTKDQRVRRPQWEERDVQLLCEAVNILSSERGRHTYQRGFKPNSLCRGQGCNCPVHSYTANAGAVAGSESGVPKVSWKKVASYIRLHGGSYHFGNATCKKKWCDVHNVELK